VNRKTNENTESVAEFKLKMLRQIQTDSLDSKQKAELVVDQTTKFVDSSAHVRNGVRYLTLLFGVFIVTEVVFYIIKRKHGSA
jgi:hypothetical protein